MADQSCRACERRANGERSLWAAAPEAISVNAFYDVPDGWSLVVQVRLADECWHLARRNSYEYLSTDELLDVLLATLASACEPPAVR